MHRRTFLMALAAPLAGCADTAVRPTAFADPLSAPYRLDSGDRVRIVVFEQPSLSGSYTVDQAGYVAMPLVGPVAARGRTTQELAGAIAAALGARYLRNPDVSAEVETHRPFFIMGEVRNPGQYVFVPGLTVEAAVAIAGGFTPRASTGAVEVTRRVGGRPVAAVVPVTDPVQPGDVLKIGQRLI